MLPEAFATLSEVAVKFAFRRSCSTFRIAARAWAQLLRSSACDTVMTESRSVSAT